MPDPVDESEEDEPFVKCRRANNNNRLGRKKINDDPPNDHPRQISKHQFRLRHGLSAKHTS